jgi:hypothetical protein
MAKPLSGTASSQPRAELRGWRKVYRIATSPWVTAALVAVGWGPLFVMDYLGLVYPHPGGNYDYWAGLALAWGLGITYPFTVLAIGLGVLQLIRAVRRFL